MEAHFSLGGGFGAFKFQFPAQVTGRKSQGESRGPSLWDMVMWWKTHGTHTYTVDFSQAEHSFQQASMLTIQF